MGSDPAPHRPRRRTLWVCGAVAVLLAILVTALWPLSYRRGQWCPVLPGGDCAFVIRSADGWIGIAEYTDWDSEFYDEASLRHWQLAGFLALIGVWLIERARRRTAKPVGVAPGHGDEVI
jgi:hypothetical protein